MKTNDKRNYWIVFWLVIASIIFTIIFGGCASSREARDVGLAENMISPKYIDDVRFKPIEGRPGLIYNPEWKNGWTPDDAPRPNLK